MPSPPQWSYLLDKDNPVKRRRSKISHFHTNEDPIVLINDSSEDESSLDKVPNISMVESNCSDVHIEECVDNGDKRDGRVCDNQVIDIIDDEIAEEVGNAFPVVVSENSDEELVMSNAIFSPKLDKEIANKKVDSFIAESEFDPQVMVILELPPKKELRTQTSSRLATLLKRLESEKVIRRHKRSKKSGMASQHESQTFTAKSVVLPSAYFTPTEHVIINTTQNDILVLPAAYFSPSQLTLVQRADSLKCFINVTLTQPWREIPLQDNNSARIIFSPSGVDIQEISLNTVVSDLKRISLLCECVKEDPEGNTWSSCSHRFEKCSCKAVATDIIHDGYSFLDWSMEKTAIKSGLLRTTLHFQVYATAIPRSQQKSSVVRETDKEFITIIESAEDWDIC
ncbi:hypothetical protein ACTXT7_000869 [Hymenolepis weldensis]